ncbi:MAG: MarC family protein [Deltaproteobacteria bacterium]|nr:MarC family protein [Deltaproteobacteria bacterium]
MDFSLLLHALTSYFVIIDPIGTAIVFHALTDGGNRSYAYHMAIRAVIISTIIVLLFGFLGEEILTSLGISIASLRVAGGLLLFYTAFNMITSQQQEKRCVDLQVDISVYPLSIPLIAGPGCLTLTILLFAERSLPGQTTALIIAILLSYLITFICMLTARHIRRFIGRTGDDILPRLLGVILAALAIQFIADGVRQLATG